jgi:hypothetical protein
VETWNTSGQRDTQRLIALTAGMFQNDRVWSNLSGMAPAPYF